MRRSIEERLKVSLTRAVGVWLEAESANGDLPTQGDELPEIMATAAFAVLRGMADAEEYMRVNDMLAEGE